MLSHDEFRQQKGDFEMKKEQNRHSLHLIRQKRTVACRHCRGCSRIRLCQNFAQRHAQRRLHPFRPSPKRTALPLWQKAVQIFSRQKNAVCSSANSTRAEKHSPGKACGRERKYTRKGRTAMPFTSSTRTPARTVSSRKPGDVSTTAAWISACVPARA